MSYIIAASTIFKIAVWDVSDPDQRGSVLIRHAGSWSILICTSWIRIRIRIGNTDLDLRELKLTIQILTNSLNFLFLSFAVQIYSGLHVLIWAWESLMEVLKAICDGKFQLNQNKLLIVVYEKAWIRIRIEFFGLIWIRIVLRPTRLRHNGFDGLSHCYRLNT